MNKLSVFRELTGDFEEVGFLDIEPGYFEPVRFAYSGNYLASRKAAAISAALPLQEDYADEQVTDAFFDGLLSEGDIRVQVSRAVGTDAGDTTGLLRALNYDTIGALVFTEGSAPTYQGASYEPLDFSDAAGTLKNAAALAEYSLRTHASLSGYVNKLGAYRDEDGNWFTPIGLAPSNCIIKFSDNDLPFDIENEMLCMLLARKLGFPTAEFEVLEHTVDGQAQAIALKRFDRTKLEGREVSGLPLYGRLHQEDFCQAFGFAAGLKYEHSGGAYFGRATKLLSALSCQPAVDINMLVDSLLFDYLVGNCDNHLKNYSLVYDADWQQIRLAPTYDKMCTLYYARYATNMGIPLDDALLHEQLSQEGVASCAEKAGYSLAYIQKRLRALEAGFEGALEEAQRELMEQGLTVPQDLVDCIKGSASFTEETIL